MDDLRPAPEAVTLLCAHAAATPDREAVVFVTDPDRADGSVTWSYAQVDAQARRVAAGLQRRFHPGGRVLLLYPAGLEVVGAFLGCLYAGMIAVLAPLPGHRHERRRVRGIAGDADVCAVLTDSASLSEVSAWADEQGSGRLACLATDTGDFAVTGAWSMPTIDRATIALLQYTSGSTAEPRGVMITHQNLLSNVDSSYRAFGSIRQLRSGGWIPLFHDMGLIGLLMTALLSGGACVLMSPMTFVRRPHLWLRMIDKFDVHITVAPNFGYELCNRRITDEQLAGMDLSRLRVAINGSEPVYAPTVRAFSRRFARAGLRAQAMTPCFGLAEATLFVAGTANRAPVLCHVDAEALERGDFLPARDGRRGRMLASCGAPRDIDVRIVDPQTLEILPPGRIGEIVLRGEGVAQGYWRNQAATRATFGVTIANGEGGFMRTGDLGTLSGGELYVTGRLKETLVVHGRNLYPQDIEHELRAQHSELHGGAGAVFTAPACGDDAMGQALVVTYEIRGRLGSEQLRELGMAIRQTVAREFGVRPATVLLLRPGAVRRTTSGKIRRTAMRELFMAGALSPLHTC